MAGHRSLSCPHCGYDQRGLPQVHDCPECGFAFDGAQVIFVNRRARFSFFLAALGVVFLLDALFQSGLWSNGGRGFSISRVGGELVLACLCLFPTLAAWVLPRWRYAVIGLDDLTLVQGERVTRIPWADIRGVWVWPTLTVVLRKEQGGAVWLDGLFDSWDEARTFASLSRRRAQMRRGKA